jgi:hypothetical protein
MKSPLIKPAILIALFFTVANNAIAQGLQADTSKPLEAEMVVLYNQIFTPQLHLYNGKEYRGYNTRFSENTPYFVNSSLFNGTVIYDGSSYQDVPMQYDMVADDLIILNYNKISKIRLIKDKVRSFTMLGHTFINLPPDSVASTGLAEGFYDLLYIGKTSVLARRTKNIQTFYASTTETKVFSKDQYYVRKNGKYFSVSSKSSFLNQLSDKKKEIKQYIKDNRIKFRKNFENAMVKIMGYYNQLTNQ